MVGHALAPLSAGPVADEPWEVRIEQAMHALHDALERRPGAVELIIAESDGNRLDEFCQQLITTLGGAGLPRDRAADVLRTGLDMIMAAVRWEVGMPADGRTVRDRSDECDS